MLGFRPQPSELEQRLMGVGMFDVFAGACAAIGRLDWSATIQALSGIATAIIAGLALRIWRRQDKARRESEFLDELIEAAHTYSTEMVGPITHLSIAKIGMKAYAKSDDKALEGAILWIQSNADSQGKLLSEALNTAKPAEVRLRMLVAKGQVFELQDYSKCVHAVEMLSRQFDRLQAFCVMIGSSTWNWENSEVLRVLTNVMALDAEDINGQLNSSNIVVMEFANKTYRRLYG